MNKWKCVVCGENETYVRGDMCDDCSKKACEPWRRIWRFVREYDLIYGALIIALSVKLGMS